MGSVNHGKGVKKSKSRKELRKANRIAKKTRKNDFHSARKLKDGTVKEKVQKTETKKLDYTPKQKKVPKLSSKEILNREVMQRNAKIKKLQRQMEKKRRSEALQDNNDDDTIRSLEKKLKLNKRKSKSIPKSFVEDGLNYILEVCDSENMEGAVSAEQQFAEINDEFEEDLALMTEKPTKHGNTNDISNDGSDDSEDMDNEDVNSNESEEDDIKFGEDDEDFDSEEEMYDGEEEFSDIEDFSDDEEQIDLKLSSQKRKIDNVDLKTKKVSFDIQSKKQKLDETIRNDENSMSDDYDDLEEENEMSSENKKDDVWEDIYGRLRGKNGELLEEDKEKYVPPARRAKMEGGAAENQRNAKLLVLEKQLKGPMNKLGEGNMHKIAIQIEGLYMNNSRNDMNETLTTLIFKAVIAEVLTSEKSVIEHALLITILHANIGTEIGAQFLQNCARKFEELFEQSALSESKKLDNVVRILAHLYNFKLFHVKLMYEILNKLSSQFTETNIECILVILQSIGFVLRKDDPLAMKDFILNLQQKASAASSDVKNDERVKYMLDILLAVKNNNTSKLKNYDTSHSDHLKKLMKGFIRKGCYVTTLNISLEDLLNADENGKWWVVGSAWSGKTNNVEPEQKPTKSVKGFSQKILELAKSQKMNTDLRRNIFCVIMSAEDYLDAFGNLLQLGLSNHQEREIVHIIIYCCLHEKVFNPFYAHLAQKFCEYDRRFMMMMKYSIWDKLKALTKCSAIQLSNLAKLLTHLFLRKCLPITTLKVVNFVELDKITLKFIRQILIGILVCDDEETCKGVFINIAQAEELRMFKESLKIFIQLFLSKNLNAKVIEEDQKKLLTERSKMIEKVLSFSSKKAMF